MYIYHKSMYLRIFNIKYALKWAQIAILWAKMPKLATNTLDLSIKHPVDTLNTYCAGLLRCRLLILHTWKSKKECLARRK